MKISGPQYQLFCSTGPLPTECYLDKLERFSSLCPICVNNHQCKALSSQPFLSCSPNPSSSFTTWFLLRFPMSVFPDRHNFQRCHVSFFILILAEAQKYIRNIKWRGKLHQDETMQRLKSFTHSLELYLFILIYRSAMTWRENRYRPLMSTSGTFSIKITCCKVCWLLLLLTCTAWAILISASLQCALYHCLE